MKVKRLRKEHFAVLMKIYLNKGHNRNDEILARHEMPLLDALVEAGYVEIINRSYSYLTVEGRGIEKVVENTLDMMLEMYEVGYTSGHSI